MKLLAYKNIVLLFLAHPIYHYHAGPSSGSHRQLHP